MIGPSITDGCRFSSDMSDSVASIRRQIEAGAFNSRRAVKQKDKVLNNITMSNGLTCKEPIRNLSPVAEIHVFSRSL